MSKETRAGKAFAEFVAALNQDFLEIAKGSGEDKEKEAQDLLERVRQESTDHLGDLSTQGMKFHTGIFGPTMDVVFNFCIFDNYHLFKAQNYDVLVERYDIVWYYFQRLIESFGFLSGMLADKEKAESTEK